jgi:zinc protease
VSGGGTHAQREGTHAQRGSSVLDRSRAPALGPHATVRLPGIQRFTLGGGLQVIVAERRELPVVNVQLLGLGGSGALAEGQAGLASLSAAMLNEGGGERTSLEIADELDRLGALYHSSAGFDASEVELNVVSTRLEPALDVLADVVLRPTFPDGELERIKSERLARIVQELDDPRALATHSFARVIFGDRHPWGSPVLGTPKTLPRISRDDVVGYYGEHLHPGCATMIVVGDVDASSLEPTLARFFGEWSPRHWKAPVIPEAPFVPECRLYLADRPAAQQSEIRVGRVAVARSTPDYFALTVMNTVLGGAFTSRLNSNLREAKGYTYSAGSGFSMRRTPGPFVAQAAVHTPVTADAVSETLREIRRICEEPVGHDELERAKRYLALRLPQRFETVSDVSARLSELVLYDLPEDYFGEYVERIMAVTADDVQQAARRHLDPKRMVVVVAGDRDNVEGPLAKLGLGPVHMLGAMPWATHVPE